jgi:hypothetical protein
MSSGVFEELKSVLVSVGTLLVEWFLAALHPVKKCRSFLAIKSEPERIRRALRLWLDSFLVSLVVYLPLYVYYGIGLKSLEFHLPIFLFLTMGMIGSGFCLWLSLRIYSIRATFPDVIAIYVAYVMCYQPLLNLFSYLVYFRFFGILATVKAQGMDLGQAASFFVAQSVASSNGPDFIYIGSRLSSWIFLPFSCACSALIARTIAERYSAPRKRSFSAVVFATTVLVPIVIAVQWVPIVFTEYVFISAKSSAALPN